MSKGERATFRACFGGWALDGMDFQFYSFVIPSLIAGWHLSKAEAGTLQTTTLLASALGGGLAGPLPGPLRPVRPPPDPPLSVPPFSRPPRPAPHLRPPPA